MTLFYIQVFNHGDAEYQITGEIESADTDQAFSKAKAENQNVTDVLTYEEIMQSGDDDLIEQLELYQYALDDEAAIPPDTSYKYSNYHP